MILGFAYKANTSDFRNTKVIDIYNELKSFGLEVNIYDPLVDIEEVKEKYSIEVLSNLEIEFYQVILKLVNHLEFENAQSDKIFEFEKYLS